MRTLKKTMCLVLVLVMLLGLGVITASSTDFTDDAQINETFAEAAEVLDGLGVFKGYTDGSFQPKGAIKRGEVAAVLYRVLTGDVDNKQVGIYTDYDKFTDVSSGRWDAGYINYVANGKYVAGNGDGTFSPDDNVTGYQVLAMMLRAIGYGQNGEFEGDGWEIRTATLAKSLGITNNIVEGTLGGNATREMVAEMIFRAITEVPTVTWNQLTGYNKYDNVLQVGDLNDTLGVAVFGLRKTPDQTIDMWGRPGYYWFKDKTAPYVRDNDNTVASFVYVPDATYTTAVPECDIAHDVGFSSNTTFTLYTNGNGTSNTTGYIVQPTDTVQKIGGQGTLTEVYYGYGQNDTRLLRIVTIDTFLAKVTDVKDATYDVNNHRTNPATIVMEVYEGLTSGDPPTRTTVTLTNGGTNYTYSKGDYLLVSVNTTNTEAADGTVTVNAVRKNADARNETTGTIDRLYGVDMANNALNGVGEIQGLAPSSSGAQTYIHYNANKHTIEGTLYNDAKWFRLDQAGWDISIHTWLRDNYGNVIGAVDPTTQYSYGVIENIQWINPLGETGYARATMRYMDGTTGVVTVRSVDLTPWNPADETDQLAYSLQVDAASYTAKPIASTAGSVSRRLVSTVLQYNNDEWSGRDLYRVSTRTDGAVDLSHAATLSLTANYINELSAANINKGTAYIIGTAATAASGTAPSFVRVNEKTQYLIRNVSGTTVTYTTVTGYQNMANYTTDSALVDYVDLDGDTYADYVYVRGDADATSTQSLFYLTSYEYVYVPTGTGTGYYQITGILNNSGEITTINVLGTPVGVPGPAGLLIPSIDSGNRDDDDTIHKLFYVKTAASGRVNYVEKINSNDELKGFTGALGNTLNGMTVVYKDKDTKWTWTETAVDMQTAADETDQLGGSGIAPVYGAWQKDLTGKEVTVIYNAKDAVAGMPKNLIIAAYVADPASRGVNSGTNVVIGGVEDVQVNYINTTTATVTVTRRAGSASAMAQAVARLTSDGWNLTSAAGNTVIGTYSNGSQVIFYIIDQVMYPVTVSISGATTVTVGATTVRNGDTIYVGSLYDGLGVRMAATTAVHAKWSANVSVTPDIAIDADTNADTDFWVYATGAGTLTLSVDPMTP